MLERFKHWITTLIGTVMILAGLVLVIWPKDLEISGSSLITLGAGLLLAKDDFIKKGLNKLKPKNDADTKTD